jgi:hypothetical protein
MNKEYDVSGPEKSSYDFFNDHLCTCTTHFFRTTHTVKTQHVTKIRGRYCGDVDLVTSKFKEKVVLTLSKSEALRSTLNLDGSPIINKKSENHLFGFWGVSVRQNQGGVSRDEKKS